MSSMLENPIPQDQYSIQEFIRVPLDPSKSLISSRGLCGLANLGNTCFMNSILQCIAHTPQLLEYFFTNKFQADIDISKRERDLVGQLNQLCRCIWYRNAIVSPKVLLHTIHTLAAKKNNGQFQGYSQNDSQEFLQFILECTHEGLAQEVNVNITGEPRNELDRLAIQAYTTFRNFFQNEHSLIVDTFYGMFKTTVLTQTKVLKEQGNKPVSRVTFDPFNMLSLEIPLENGVTDDGFTIYDCLDHFTKTEVLETKTADEYKVKRLSFWSLPDVLVVFFKRFNNMGRKINVPITFNLNNLDFSKYMSGYNRKSYKYSVYGVVNHTGGTGGGHYYAYVKHLDNQWYCFNDQSVSVIEEKNVCSPNAYCLFLKKNKDQGTHGSLSNPPSN